MIRFTTMGRAWIALAVLACSSREATAECRPTAVPYGEPTLVRLLGERLAASGIAITAAAGCPIARVRVEQRGEQIHVEVTDTFGRTGTREVHDVATAATIVESWTSQEIDEGSLPPESVTKRAPVTSSTWRHGITAAFESSAGGDRSFWIGGAVSGCIRIGPACAGAIVRATRDASAGSSGAVIDHDTQQLAALATIGLPRRFGGFVVTPGIGVGYGWQEITEHHHDAHGLPIDVLFSSHALLADVHVSAARPIGRHLSLYVDLRADTAVTRTALPYGAASFVRAAFGVRLGAE
jgi:hypothetical protein